MKTNKRDERDFGSLQEALLGQVVTLKGGKQVLVREEDIAKARYQGRKARRRQK